MTDPRLDEEDTREVWCPRCGRRLTGESDVCPSCGTRSRDASPPVTALDEPADLERALAAAKHERRQLLKHLIAKGDELDGLQHELTALRAEHETLRTQLAQAGSHGKPKPARHPFVRLAIVLAILAAVAAIGIGLFEVFVARPARGRLAARLARLDAQLTEVTKTNEILRNDLAAKEQLLDAGGPDGRKDALRPEESTSPDRDVSNERKVLADRLAAVEQENQRLGQLRRDLEAERQKQLEGRKALEDERDTLQKRVAALTQSANAAFPDGVLIWRGDVTASTAILINGNKANYGTVTGSMPARPATMRLQVFEGEAKVIEGPGPKNNWNQLYFQALGKGRVTVFLLWVSR